MAQSDFYGNWLCPPSSPGKGVVKQPEIYSSGTSAHERYLDSDSFTDEEDYDDVAVSEVEGQMQQGMPAHEGNAEVAIQRSKGNTGVYFLAGKPATSSLSRKEDYVLAGNPATSSLPRKAVPVLDTNQETGYRKKSIVMLYTLMGICFAMWAILFSLAVVKYMEISEELKSLNKAHSEGQMNELKMPTDFNSINNRLRNVSKELDGLRQRIQEIQADHRKDTSDHQDFTEIKTLTHAVLKELVDMRQNDCRLEEALNKVQEELQSITEIICTKCPPGWQQFEKNCYYFSTSTTTWSDAKQFCTSVSSQLVIVNSEQENAFLSNRVITQSGYWLGATDSEKEGEWKWLDGSPVSLTFWAKGEPNNAEHMEDCATLCFDRTWNDAPCSTNGRWICERSC